MQLTLSCTCFSSNGPSKTCPLRGGIAAVQQWCALAGAFGWAITTRAPEELSRHLPDTAGYIGAPTRNVDLHPNELLIASFQQLQQSSTFQRG